MLTRAVRRRQTLRYAKHAAERIQLPWLCPALWSSHATQAGSNHRPVAPRPRVERSTSAARLSTHTPKLASAAPIQSLFDLQNGHTPFDFTQHSSPSSDAYRLPSLAPDLNDILMIDHSTAAGPEVLDFGRKHKYIRGNALEIEATLDACLQIHRWDRSHELLSQLRAIYDGDRQQLQRLYNKVLEAMVFDHIWNQTTENVRRINGWVENDMKKAGVPPNAQTFALKIKAAMATLQGRKRDRTVRRYWEMAKDYNVDWEVASLRGILSDSDLGKLSEISPLETGYDIEDAVQEETEHIAVRDDMIAQQPPPAIRETSQKGLGMVSLRQSLSLFSDVNQMDEWDNIKDADAETRATYARERQMRLEQDSLRSAADRWRIEHEKMVKMGISGNLSQGRIGSLTWTWYQQLLKSLEAELEKVNAAEMKDKKSEEDRLRTEYGPFLRLVPASDLAALTVTTIIQLMTKLGINTSVKLVRLVADLGRTVEAEVEAQVKRHNERRKQSLQASQPQASVDGQASAAATIGAAEVLDISVPTLQHIHWSVAQCAKVGSILCELLFDAAKIDVKHEASDGGRKLTMHQPAFDRRSAFVNGRRMGIVSLHPELVQLLTKEPVADLIAKQLPMVCKPKPWSGYEEGGYFEAKNPVLRIKYVDQAQKEYTKAAAERGDLDQLFKGLDVLGQTGWRINLDVFKVMVDAWNTGEEIANLPPVDKVFAEVPKPAANASAKERYQYHKQVQAINNERGGLHSNRCFQNFQMEIARAYANEVFYLPHNVDFRGRAYPIPPYLNQMGADNARGLLTFAQGRELGERGFKWLKVHLANVCGYDKASLTDRAQFADDHIQDIRDSVQNPLSGKRWWLKAEDPWQCLATCFELVKAIDSGDPQTFVSHIPIHQDGTCNGLQHYAALGGDVAGARQVNLEPGDRPADVYTGVAELVKAEIKKDAEAGVEMGKLLDGRITRKIVKQTVMTNVYGVTFHGAMDQVKKQLDDLLPDLKAKRISSAASSYIARKIFKGLGTLFEGAHDIQYWFGDCANRITNSVSPAQMEEAAAAGEASKAKKTDRRTKNELGLAQRKEVDSRDFRSTVVWTTPLRLPVVQPYRVSRAQIIQTHMASFGLTEPSVTDSVDKRKQLQAFPPNFIHSLDATHMMLSALQAHQQGLTFSAVHDSFWTHAADVDTLNSLLRDAFIRMHTEDIVGRLKAEFQMRYKGHLYLAKVDASSDLAQKISEYRLKINKDEFEVSTSTKKSKSKSAEKRRQYYELMQEYKRQKLIASTDPKEQAKGKKMVTAASIFESMDGEKYLKAKNSLGETALAHIPESQSDPAKSAVVEAMDNDEHPESHDVDMASTLEPLVDKQTQDGTILPGARRATKQKSRAGAANKSVWLWLPLTFKEVPKKGDWDVRRLKDSVYFFS